MHTKRARYIAVIIALAVFAVGFFGNVIAKYVTSAKFSGNVTYHADIASAFILNESKAERQSDGSYTLNNELDVIGNNYYVMPGVDIPKNPKVFIGEKTDVTAYLYVEIIATMPSSVSYTVNSQWELLDGITGANGGAVYAYKGATAEPLPLDNSNCPDTYIEILENNLLNVEQEYAGEPVDMDFYAYLIQVNGTAAETYDSIY